MKTFTITFDGRLRGALGLAYTYVQTVRADNIEAASLGLYEGFEHIRIISYSEK